jgi:hypothetical protein
MKYDNILNKLIKLLDFKLTEIYELFNMNTLQVPDISAITQKFNDLIKDKSNAIETIHNSNHKLLMNDIDKLVEK